MFKYPGNAKQNYIKRLVGLPGEHILIRHGDIFVRTESEEAFSIARKPPRKVQTMLQVVHDSDYLGQRLSDAGWPSRWRPVSRSSDGVWRESEGGQDDNGKGEFVIEGDSLIAMQNARALHRMMNVMRSGEVGDA